jgi:hypothetical protein
MRTGLVVVVLLASLPALATPDKSSLDSEIGGTAFHARTALITEANAPTHVGWSDASGRHEGDVVVSTLYVFEREVSCRDFKRVEHGRYVVDLGDSERAIELQVQGTWPFRARTVLSTEAKDPMRDHVSAILATSRSGSVADGRVTVVESTRDAGVLDLDLDTRKFNGTDHARGTIRVVVCR